jgi:hypothetical protein
MKRRIKFLILALIVISCSDDNNSSSDNSLSNSLNNSQWVFNNYEFLNDEATQEDIDGGSIVAIGNEFSIEQVEDKNNLIWQGFFVSFNDDGTGNTQDFTALSDNEIHSMEWSIIGNNNLRIVYQVQDDLDPNTFDARIVNLENVEVENNIFSWEVTTLTRMQGTVLDAIYVKHRGVYSFN